jgi:hypothetical protein
MNDADAELYKQYSLIKEEEIKSSKCILYARRELGSGRTFGRTSKGMSHFAIEFVIGAARLNLGAKFKISKTTSFPLLSTN